MAITRVAVASNADTGTTDTTLTLTMPAGIAAGDGALLGFSCASGAPVPTITSNGLSVTPVPVGSGVATFPGHQSRLWALPNLAAADSGKVLTVSTGTTAVKVALALIVLRGVSGTNLVDVATSKTSTAAVVNPSNPALTTSIDGAGILEFFFPTRGNSVPQIAVVTKPSTAETLDVQAFTSELSGATGAFIGHDSSGTGVGTNFRAWAADSTVTPVTYTVDQAAVYSAWTVAVVPKVTGPTVDAGGTQTLPAGQLVTLTGTDTPAAGTTIASRQWTVITYPGATAPTLAGATTATATFTPPAGGGKYVLRYRVTDSTGAFNDATAVVYATTTDARPNATPNAGIWTAVGATTLHAAVADDSDTTWAQAVNPSGSSFTLAVPPAPVGGKTVSYRVQVDPTTPGTGTWLVEYLNGGNGAVVASKNETTTATGVIAGSIVLTDAQNAVLTDSLEHQLRFTGTAS